MKETGTNQADKQGVGEKFQEETKYTPEKIGGHYLDWNRTSDRCKDYDESFRKVSLPDPQIDKTADIWNIISKRRSVRQYISGKIMALNDLAALLWATQGITAESRRFQFRAAPSAGGLYPIETYLMVRDVERLEPGIYHFRPHRFDLEFLRAGDWSVVLANAALGQRIVADAQVCFVWTAVVERSKWKYRQRAYRYIYLDAGHIAQNLYLAGTAAGMGVCGIGAFFDDGVNDLLGVDGVEETVVYLASVGLAAD
ncbi:MAG: SagB/ThcOx family dehydrogenase [Acidobacteria bacterium]|nr:SagB/ThcOx family dehydrogenase [Acidobacteriota bacterium]